MEDVVDNDTIGVIVFIAGALLVLAVFGVGYTVFIAAKEAHEWFARENVREQMRREDDEA